MVGVRGAAVHPRGKNGKGRPGEGVASEVIAGTNVFGAGKDECGLGAGAVGVIEALGAEEAAPLKLFLSKKRETVKTWNWISALMLEGRCAVKNAKLKVLD